MAENEHGNDHHGEDHAHEGEHHGDSHGDYAHHDLGLGRKIEHPPEMPHLIQVLWYQEQYALRKEYVENEMITPEEAEHAYIEKWLTKDKETGEWKEVEGESPTPLQVLHAGTLKEKLPLIGYAPWENHAYLLLVIILLVSFLGWLTAPFRADKRKAMRNPCRRHMTIEMIVGAFDDFTKGVLGPENGRKYLPFIATLFCVILFSNLMGMIPLLRAPSASILITFSFALCTFIVVQGTAWTRLGPLTYIHHLMGSPKDAIGWVLSPLFLVLEIISDFLAKPGSLALRLFGNILGKDILFGVFMILGIQLVGQILPPAGNYFGVPLTIPFYLLGLLLATIQALVFSLLSCIYIMLVLPHDHDHHDDHGDHGHEHPEKSFSPGEVHEKVPG